MNEFADRLFFGVRGEETPRRRLSHTSRELPLHVRTETSEPSVERIARTAARAHAHTPRTELHLHAGHAHGHAEPAPALPYERRTLTPKERRGQVWKVLKDPKFYAGLAIFIIDQLSGHAADVALAPFLPLIGAVTLDDLILGWLLVSLSKLESAWRGYEAPKKGTPYQGEGHPDSAVTYAIENLRGAYDEGWWKKGVSAAVLVGSVPLYPLMGALTEAGKVIGWAWKSRESDLKNPILRWAGKMGWTIAASPAIVGAAVWGAAQGLWRLGKEVWDGRKLKDPKSVPA